MKTLLAIALVAAALMTFTAVDVAAQSAQTTAFTYQGQLDAGGTLATGT